MLISVEWLNEFVDLKDITPEQIAHELTMSGLEVEDTEKIGAKFTNIVTAEIKDIKQHPNADKLHLVEVNIGNQIKTVVCGAQNIEVGQIIPFASVGSKVCDRKTGEQFELTPARIRGVVSDGMLCSQDELGLEGMQEEDGILILNRIYEEIELGQPVEKLLNISEDTVLNVAPTANRGDELSAAGIASELAAIFNRPLNFSPLECTNEYPDTGFRVEIKDPETCSYYAAGILENVKIKPSPEWMKRRLEACGIRSINNVVDITNYVLLEYGQPLHSFDKDKLNGYLCVRRAKEGEKIITLDETERNLTHDSVLIATEESPVCVAGVFGGINSGIDDNTKNIVLESAYFTPSCNRKSARSIGYRSEASARFERGVDYDKVKPALFRAMQLMHQFADAEIKGITEAGDNKLPEITITLRFTQIEKVTGTVIEPDRAVEILERLGFKLTGRNQIAANFKVPGARRNDVTREIDLIEEIARIHGYDKIEPTLPSKTQAPTISFETEIQHKLCELFTGHGFYEAMSSSLIGEPLLKKYNLSYNEAQAVRVKKAQSEDHTMLRQTLVAGMLEAFKTNYDNGQKNLRLFEIGKTYFLTDSPTERYSGTTETTVLSGVLTGEIGKGRWKDKTKTDFYTLKGVIDDLFSMLELSERIKYSPASDTTFLHPGRSAVITLSAEGNPQVGIFGEVHPILKEKMKSNQPIYIFELNLSKIIKSVSQKTIKFKKLPQYPAIQRDIAFAIPEDVTYERISKAIKKSADGKLFESCELFDIYTGEHIEKGFKSIAVRIKLQDYETTMTDERIENEISKIREGIKKNFPEVIFR